MKIVNFINPWQRDVIEKILTHCGLWSRTPPDPREAKDQARHALTYVAPVWEGGGLVEGDPMCCRGGC